MAQAARPVSGVGLGLSYYPASLLWSPGPRPSPVFRSAVCDCLSLNVSVSQYSFSVFAASGAGPKEKAGKARLVGISL
jgi:hypothetical protein